MSWDSSPWKINVLDLADINATPPTEVDGDRYILIEVASTVVDAGWDGAIINDLVEYSSTLDTWGSYTPSEGDKVYDEDSNNTYKFDGADWVIDGPTQVTADSGSIAFDFIRHTITAGEAAGGSFTESWSTATMAKIIHLTAVNFEPGSQVTGANSSLDNGAVVNYDGSTMTCDDVSIGSDMIAGNIFTIHIVYEK